MKFKNYRFGIVYTITVVGVIVFTTLSNFPNYDDSVTKYSIIKDSLSVFIAIVGLKLASDWKEQTIFTQKNAKAIELYGVINVLQSKFRYNLYTLHHIRNAIKMYYDMLPEQIKLANSSDKKYSKDEKNKIKYCIGKINTILNNASKTIDDLRQSTSTLNESTYQAFILREYLVTDLTDISTNLIDPIFCNFPTFYDEIIPEDILVDSDFLDNLIWYCEEILKIPPKSINEISEQVNDLFLKQKKILEKYF